MWASDFVCGVKRFYPTCKRRLETASSCLKCHDAYGGNAPVQAMAAVAYIRKHPEMAQALLLGFAGVLRVGEILNAKLVDLSN